jgi:ABC-2 type transport system ATP-binding protein
MMPEAVRVMMLKKKYGSRIALDGITFSIAAGSCYGLVGPNGAGKSTLINILSGVTLADDGEVVILGSTLSPDNRGLKSKIGVVLDGLSLFEQLTCEEHLLVAGQLYALPSALAVERSYSLLRALGLWNDRRRPTYQLSSGGKKKLAFAAALLHSPRLLVLDEPFESVDTLCAATMREILRSIVRNGRTVLITSHNLHMMENVCDTAAIIDRGRIMLETKIQDIRTTLRAATGQERYRSLEEVFLDVIADREGILPEGSLTWL